jgi:hypothetical protein
VGAEEWNRVCHEDQLGWVRTKAAMESSAKTFIMYCLYPALVMKWCFQNRQELCKMRRKHLREY